MRWDDEELPPSRMTWLLVFVVSLLGLCILAPVAHAQYQPHLASEVTCSPAGAPVRSPFDTAALAYGLTQAENDLHEAEHMRQLEGDCTGTLALWRLEPLLRLEAEVQATCVGFAAVPPERRLRRRQAALRALFDLYAEEIPFSAGPPFGVLTALFDRYCGQ